MANKRKRQQARARKAAKRKAKKRKAKKKRARRENTQRGHGPSLSTMAGWNLHECMISATWREHGTLRQILIARRSVSGGVGVAVMLVDCDCLGVKDGFVVHYESLPEYRERLRESIVKKTGLEPCSIDLAAKVVEEATAYADKLGFKPHPDGRMAMVLLGDADPSACSEPVALGGEDGKPCFWAGPDDDVPGVLATLRRSVGEGGFHYIIGKEHLPGEATDTSSAYPDTPGPAAEDETRGEDGPGAGCPPTPAEWREAFRLAEEVRQLAPWEWMAESHVLGFVEPDSGRRRFISIMGKSGDHLTVVVYRSEEDVARVFDDVSSGNVTAETAFGVSKIQLVFENRADANSHERRLFKSLGASFRGRNAWPCFRGLLPARVPAMVDQLELRTAVMALQQVLAWTPSLRDDPDGLAHLEDALECEGKLPLRVPATVDGETIWEEQEFVLDPGLLREEPEAVPPEQLGQVRGLAVHLEPLEVLFRMVPSPLQEDPDQRPHLPYVLLLVESCSGMVRAVSLVPSLPSSKALYRRLPATLVGCLQEPEAGPAFRPAELRVRRPRVAKLIGDVCDALGIELTVVPVLPAAEEAFEALVEVF